MKNPSKKTKDVLVSPLAKLIAFSLASTTSSLNAAEFVVEFNSSAINGGDQISLPEAIISANANPGVDTISFINGLAGSEIELTYTLTVTEDVIIDGSNQLVPVTIVVEDSNAFDINNASITINNVNIDLAETSTTNAAAIDLYNSILTTDVVSIANPSGDSAMRALESVNSNINLNNTSISGMRGDEAGAAINFASTGTHTLSIAYSDLSDNRTSNGNGSVIYAAFTGAVVNANVSISNSSFNNNVGTGPAVSFYNNGGTVTSNISNSEFAFNRSQSNGSVFSFNASENSNSNTVISNSTIRDNVSSANGGAIAISNTEAGAYLRSELTILNSTISGNEAFANGGAIFIDNDEQTTSNRSDTNIINSTIANNSANAYGGVLAFASEDSLNNIFIDVVNSTISGNTASTGGGIIYLPLDEYAAPLANINFSNTVVANSYAVGAEAQLAEANDIEFNFNVNAYTNFIANNSLIENVSVASTAALGVGLITGVDPLLGELADNGSTTLTMVPAVDSPLIDAGDNDAAIDQSDAALTTDQRGEVRIVNETIDIGAVERIPTPEEIAAAEEEEPRQKSGGPFGSLLLSQNLFLLISLFSNSFLRSRSKT